MFLTKDEIQISLPLCVTTTVSLVKHCLVRTERIQICSLQIEIDHDVRSPINSLAIIRIPIYSYIITFNPSSAVGTPPVIIPL